MRTVRGCVEPGVEGQVGAAVLGDELVDSRFVLVDFASSDPFDSAVVDVGAGHAMPEVGQAHRRGESDVSTADHSYRAAAQFSPEHGVDCRRRPARTEDIE